MRMIVLVKDKTFKGWTEMRITKFRRQFADKGFPFRCLPSFETVEGIAGLDDDILNNKILISFETAAGRRNLFRFDNLLLMDDEFAGLFAFG